MLVISSAFATGLEFLRIYISKHNNYLYFIWNLFLAWIPYAISMYLPLSYHLIRSKFLIWLLVIVWFLFWPNSPYIITDLLHLKEKQNIPLWYDLGLILSFAWTGLMLGFISLLEIQNFVRRRINRFCSWVFAVFTIITGSLGIYLGRYIRINSWDALVNPIRVYTDLIEHFQGQMERIETLGMTLLYAIFLFLAYLMIKEIIKIPDRLAQ
jgi:uncharacterized membrane protein